jgi:mono/diheme cytochrome c family protein
VKYFSTIFVVLSFALVAAGQGAPSGDRLTDDAVYRTNCAKCHGKTGEGRHFAGPSLVSEKTAATSGDELRSIITNGKHRMPKFEGKLTAEEIDRLVREIKQSK